MLYISLKRVLNQEHLPTITRPVLEKQQDIKNQPSIETISITTEESDLLKMGIQNL